MEIELPKSGSVWTHVTRGSVYTVMGRCTIEATWKPGVIYMAHADGRLIVRDLEEFCDGRFKQDESRHVKTWAEIFVLSALVD